MFSIAAGGDEPPAPSFFERSANERYSPLAPGAHLTMAEAKCATCGGPLTQGFVATTNGSGLYWAQEKHETRVRPAGLEVLVPTGFMGTYSANVPASRCPHCRTITLRLADAGKA